MVLILRALAITLVVLALAVATVWCAGALWFRLPAGETMRAVAAGAAGLVGLAVIAAQFTRRRLVALAVFAVMLAGVMAWWSTIHPAARAYWSPDVARQTTGEIIGDRLILRDIRAFDWHGPHESTPNWIDAEYDLSQVQTVDLFMSYWGSPIMAHLVLSFGFADGRYLAWSVEVRRKIEGKFSPVADFFKEHTLSILAAEERDVVGVRSNFRGEDVQLYRLRASPQVARALLGEYVRDANQLAAQPAFYNSIFTNCTTTVLRMMAAVGDRLPFDWRLLANGFLPEYAYDHDAVATRLPLETLREKGRIAARAKAAGLGDGFSRAIREGVPSPQP